jgi:hypothetical protein
LWRKILNKEERVMGNIFKDIVTGIDNQTYDIGRLSYIIGLLVFLGLEIYVVAWKAIPFDMQAFGISFGAMLASLGAALNLKAKTEPGERREDKKDGERGSVSIREMVIIAIAFMAVTVALWGWYHPQTVNVPGPVEYRDITKEVKVEPKVVCKDNTITVVQPETVKQPIEGPKESVIAEGSVPASNGGFNLVTELSPSTGQATMEAIAIKQPLFGFPNEKEVGVRIGISGDKAVYGDWTLIRVGAIYGGLYAEIDSKDKASADIEVSYRW